MSIDVDFQFDLIDTILLIRDSQGKIIKTTRPVSEGFNHMTKIEVDKNKNIETYYDMSNDTIWEKKSNLIVSNGCQYIQEEYTNVTNLWKKNRQLMNRLKTDELTKIPNRVAAEERKKNIIGSNKGCTLVMCDINNFKHINDGQGHVVGDKCLTAIAQLFNNYVGPSDLVARIGGDEFLFIIDNDNVLEVIEMMEDIQNKVTELGKELGIDLSVSMGTSSYQYNDDWDLKRAVADKALYNNKEIYKSRTGIRR